MDTWALLLDKTIENFMKKGSFDFPVYRSLEPAPQLLQASAIPKTFIVSKEGIIVLDKTGSAKWHGDKIVKLLNDLALD